MDNLHLHIIAVVLYLNLPGSVGTKSRWILPATHHHSECRWDGLFLLNCSFTRIATIPEDISQIAVTADFSYNNIKTFLCSVGRNEEWMLKHLNLSNNLISELTLTTCTNLCNLETLNLSDNAIHTLTLDMGKIYRSVDHLLPALKVLSVERNNLNTVPRGLLQSLQTVHMSSNAIQQIDSKDFQNCSQLKYIDLRNNKITKIHPDAFRHSKKLQVVDLRENALTIPLPQIIISLNFFQLEVYLSKNAWIFNCRINAFKHLFHFLFDSTERKWSLSYNKSANNSQKPQLYLSSFRLNCRDRVLLKWATIPTGNTSVLTCNLDNIRGMYIRHSIQIQKETEPNFALAVSLSVLITFVCAFCLGAFARPYLVSLWRLMHRNKNSGSEHTYCNQAFSDETLSTETTDIFPTSTLYENVTDSGAHPPNPEAEYQKQSNTEINMKKTPEVQTSTDNNESVHIYDNGLFSVHYHNSNELTPNSQVSNNSGLLQSDITKATSVSPESKGIVSHNEPRHTTKFMQGSQICEEQLGLNGNKNRPSNAGDFVSPSSSRRDADIENLSIHETENSPLTEHDCKRIHSAEKDASADIFGDSSSAEGTPFTMSDCSSLADSELEQPDVSDNLPICQSSLEDANINSGTEKLLILPESPNVSAELQQIGKNEDGNSAYFETTINYGSDSTMHETASPYTDKCSGHVSTLDPETVSSSSQAVPDTFDYFTNAESPVQNSISDSLHGQSTDLGNTVLKLKHSPTYDTENICEEAELQPSLLPNEPQHSLNFSHTEKKENAPERTTDEHIARNNPEKNHGEAGITLRKNMSTSEDNGFIFAPTDTGLNEVVKRTSLLHSSKESSLQLLPEHTAENLFMFITHQDDLLPQGKQTCADQIKGGSDEKNSDGCTELQDASKCSLPEETQSCNLTADLLHLHSSGKTESDFTTDYHFQLDQSDEDAYSFSVPRGFFSETTQYSSCSLPQKPTGNTISESPDSSKMVYHTTLTELENHSTTAVEHLQNSSENLSQESQTNLGQEQFFVKKKRAFDGFANILQSRRTNFNS
uniref:Leucine-rich repeat-containing protein 66 n=1 Tax=Malurus cyaneus samueli TaxID=2593467 RepID=A0A8C5T1Z2_9PASS